MNGSPTTIFFSGQTCSSLLKYFSVFERKGMDAYLQERLLGFVFLENKDTSNQPQVMNRPTKQLPAQHNSCFGANTELPNCPQALYTELGHLIQGSGLHPWGQHQLL